MAGWAQRRESRARNKPEVKLKRNPPPPSYMMQRNKAYLRISTAKLINARMKATIFAAAQTPSLLPKHERTCVNSQVIFGMTERTWKHTITPPLAICLLYSGLISPTLSYHLLTHTHLLWCEATHSSCKVQGFVCNGASCTHLQPRFRLSRWASDVIQTDAVANLSEGVGEVVRVQRGPLDEPARRPLILHVVLPPTWVRQLLHRSCCCCFCCTAACSVPCPLLHSRSRIC